MGTRIISRKREVIRVQGNVTEVKLTFCREMYVATPFPLLSFANATLYLALGAICFFPLLSFTTAPLFLTTIFPYIRP